MFGNAVLPPQTPPPIFYFSSHRPQLTEHLQPLWLEFSRIHQFAVVLDPVEHLVLFYTVFGVIAMVDFHKVDDFLPFRNPLLILGHNKP